jgi:hypothetical protein
MIEIGKLINHRPFLTVVRGACNVGRASSLSRQGSHGGIMDAFTDMLAVRGCGSSETICPEL